jgi:hypothetical protein
MPDAHLNAAERPTLDVADGHAIGERWQDDAAAVVDVDTPVTGGTVTLRLELDRFGLRHLDAHVDTVSLTPTQARLLARALESAAVDADPTTLD